MHEILILFIFIFIFLMHVLYQRHKGQKYKHSWQIRILLCNLNNFLQFSMHS